MKRAIMLLSLAMTLSVFTVHHASSMGASSAPSATGPLVKGNTAFALSLYRQLGAKDGNLFFSPHSVSTALAMTWAGARENTEKEMAKALHFNMAQGLVHSSFKSLSTDLADTVKNSGQTLNVANALILTGGDVGSAYRSFLENTYDADIFRGDLDDVNLWVKKKTDGKIPKILDELDVNSVCVILNAISFKGLWDLPFDKARTREAPFHVSASRQVNALMMSGKSRYRLLTEQDFQAVSIPYRNNSLSMVVLLPRTVDGLAALEKQLTAENLNLWLSGLDASEPRTLRLSLPKFKLESGHDLKQPFQALGMNDAFLENIADFRGMGFAKKGEVWIGQVKHKAFVDVNEEGTEAAGATAVEMVTKSVSFDPVFRADHPFLFLIRHTGSGSVLFMGRLADPLGK